MLEHVEFLWPIHAAARSRGLQQRDNFTAALLNVAQAAGAFHGVVKRMFAAAAAGQRAEGEGDVLGGLVRLYLFQQGTDYCRLVLGDVVRSLATSGEELSTVQLADVEADQIRRTRLDNAVKAAVGAICLPQSVAALPRGIRALAALLGSSAEAKKLLVERLILPVVSAAVEFELLSEEEAKQVTPQGRSNLATVARMLLLASRGTSHPALDRFAEEAIAGDWSAETNKEVRWENAGLDKLFSDVDMSFFVATVANCCVEARDELVAMGAVRDERLFAEYDEAVVRALPEVSREWSRRNAVKELVAASQNAAARADCMIAGLETVVAARTKKDLHELFVQLREKLEALRTFLLLSAKQLNKRAHPTQWQLHGGAMSDLLKVFASFYEPFVNLRFALKAAIPLIANRMLEDELKVLVHAVLVVLYCSHFDGSKKKKKKDGRAAGGVREAERQGPGGGGSARAGHCVRLCARHQGLCASLLAQGRGGICGGSAQPGSALGAD